MSYFSGKNSKSKYGENDAFTVKVKGMIGGDVAGGEKFWEWFNTHLYGNYQAWQNMKLCASEDVNRGALFPPSKSYQLRTGPGKNAHVKALSADDAKEIVALWYWIGRIDGAPKNQHWAVYYQIHGAGDWIIQPKYVHPANNPDDCLGVMKSYFKERAGTNNYYYGAIVRRANAQLGQIFKRPNNPNNVQSHSSAETNNNNGKGSLIGRMASGILKSGGNNDNNGNAKNENDKTKTKTKTKSKSKSKSKSKTGKARKSKKKDKNNEESQGLLNPDAMNGYENIYEERQNAFVTIPVPELLGNHYQSPYYAQTMQNLNGYNDNINNNGNQFDYNTLMALLPIAFIVGLVIGICCCLFIGGGGVFFYIMGKKSNQNGNSNRYKAMDSMEESDQVM